MVKFGIRALVLITVILFSCQPESSVTKSKLELSPALQKAWDHYSDPHDSLKRKALLFLVEHIENKSGLNKEIAAEFMPLLQQIHSIRIQDSLTQAVKDSLANMMNYRIALNKDAYIPDLAILDENLLIENIDYAFKAWALPWTSNLTFENFCAYILPYRFEKEPLSAWRKLLFTAQTPLVDSLVKAGVTSPLEVCKVLNDRVFKRYVFHSVATPPVTIEDLDKLPVGECIPRYHLLAALGRSIGLPLAIDFTPQYSRFPGDHSWISLVDDGTGKLIAFNGGDKWEAFPFRGVKMYRNMYANYPKADVGTRLPPLFTNVNYLDVTDEYESYDIRDLELALSEEISEGEPIYLYTFGVRRELVPIGKGTIRNGKAFFRNLSFFEQAIVIPAKIEEMSPVPLTNPVVIKPDYPVEIFNPERVNSRKVTIFSKYPVTYLMEPFTKNIVGARVQGANNLDFSDAVTLLTIEDAPQHFKSYKIDNKKAFRFYRYLPRAEATLNLAEFRFYLDVEGESESVPYHDELISSNAIRHNVKFVFDENIRTNLNAEAGQWFGIHVKGSTLRRLDKVKVLARNDYNVIEKGHLYELLYYDRGWRSLGKKTATDFYIEFGDVPAHALLILRNLTEGQQERVFTYESHGQLYW